MKIKYEDITKEQFDIYYAVKKACFLEDLKMVLEEDYEIDINSFSDAQIDRVFDKYEDYRDDGSWREDMHIAINRILDV